MEPEEGLRRAAEVLSSASEVALACHMNPDPDAIGSMLGLSSFLRSRGVQTVCSFGNDPFDPPRWAGLLPGGDDLVPPAAFPKVPDILVTLDTASLDRLGSLVGRAHHAREVIWIDHHISNDGLGTIPVVDPQASSTCEMVVRLIRAMGGELTADSATCLYAGLVTDTGRFQYQAVTPETLRLAADLRALPFDHTHLVQALYDDNSVGYLRLLGTALHRVALDVDADLTWTYLTREDLADAEVHPAETDDMIDIVRTARESDVAAVIKQQMDGRFKVSLRSRGSTDVSAVAQRFGGGGHRLAAGYTGKAGLHETLGELTAALRDAPKSA